VCKAFPSLFEEYYHDDPKLDPKIEKDAKEIGERRKKFKNLSEEDQAMIKYKMKAKLNLIFGFK